MRNSITYRRLASAAFAFALVLGGADAATACLSPEQSRQVVASGEAMTLSQALRRAGVSGTPVNVALCPGGGGYVYQVSVREPDGTLRTVTIPAS
jgi:uncharacterized membrane protein YkoI